MTRIKRPDGWSFLTFVFAGCLAACGLCCSASSAAIGNSGGDGNIVYFDASPEANPPEAGAQIADGGALACTLFQPFVASGPAGCRADWSCTDGNVHTFVCGPIDGGGAQCYCIVDITVAGSGIGDNACADGLAGVERLASSLCGWTFSPSAADGGGQ
jgi:hypothetical protein